MLLNIPINIEIHYMNNICSILKLKIVDTISPCMPNNLNNICIIYPPNRSNVGDCAIFAGELDFLRSNYPSTHISYLDKGYGDKIRNKYIKDASLLAFNGGGSFGDLYPAYHESCLSILEKFPSIPKIQFPQSIYFEIGGLLQRTQRAIARQKNYKFFVRDNSSFEFAKKHFDCEIHLCPDMAFSLRPLKRRAHGLDYFCLLRTDKEILFEKTTDIATVLNEYSLSHKVDDWIEPDQSVWTSLDNFLPRRGSRHPQLIRFIGEPLFYIREKFAWARINHGISLLSRGKKVITDRLHGHILATLLDIPHFVFDSYDGKISAFHETWLLSDENVKFVKSIEELSEQLDMKQ